MSADKITRGEGKEKYVTWPTMPLVQSYFNLGIQTAPGYAFTTTTAGVSNPDTLLEIDGLAVQLIVDYQLDQVTPTVGTDGVVSGTGVWTFNSYTFTGLTGAKLWITGAANAGNNGLFAITAVSGHTATTATTGLVTETFGAGVQAYVVRSEAASVPTGNWTIQGSNDYDGPGYGDIANQGHFAAVTTLFNSPAAVAAVTDASSQIVQPPNHFSIKALTYTFTPTAGRGVARVARFGKSWCR